MLIFVKMQNWIKWQTDTCSSVQNNQKSVSASQHHNQALGSWYRKLMSGNDVLYFSALLH